MSDSNQPKEAQYLFDKRVTRAICDKEFKNKVVKTGKARFLGTDEDLRPKYSNLDTIKYDVYMCPYCGYASVSREFENVTPKQRLLLKAEVCNQQFGINNPTEDIGYYDYDMAIARYKRALLIATKKPSKVSECSYLRLKIAWLNRSMYEEIIQDKEEESLTEEEKAKYDKYKSEEKNYLKEAYEGFVEALLKEYPPICGMDECTFNYLMSVLSYKNGEYDNALRFGYDVIQSINASSKLKDKQRELLDKLKDMKKSEN